VAVEAERAAVSGMELSGYDVIALAIVAAYLVVITWLFWR
jgi:hypothetical protein